MALMLVEKLPQKKERVKEKEKERLQRKVMQKLQRKVMLREMPKKAKEMPRKAKEMPKKVKEMPKKVKVMLRKAKKRRKMHEAGIGEDIEEGNRRTEECILYTNSFKTHKIE